MTFAQRAFAWVLFIGIIGTCGGCNALDWWGSIPSSSTGRSVPQTPTPMATATPNASSSPGSGGVVVIPIPTPAPVLCTPSPVTIAVGQQTVIQCEAQGYAGAFAIMVADPTIATVTPVAGADDFFYVSGVRSGTTTLTLTYGSGGSGTEQIIVP